MNENPTHYKYMVIDAQAVLRTQFEAIKGASYFSVNALHNGFLNSINKIKREFLEAHDDHYADKLILVWDRAPYYRHTLMPTYKADRVYLTDEDLEQFKEVELTEEMRVEKEKIEKGLAQNAILQTAKWDIIKKWWKIGLPSVIRDGWEADDFAYIFSREIAGPDSKVLLVSRDSDWPYLVNDHTDVWNYFKLEFKTLAHFEEPFDKDVVDVKSLDPYEHESYIRSLSGSHNGLSKTVSKEADENYSWIELYNLIKVNGAKDYTDDPELFDIQFSTFDIKNFPDYEEAKELVEDSLEHGYLIKEDRGDETKVLMAGISLNFNHLIELSWLMEEELFTSRY